MSGAGKPSSGSASSASIGSAELPLILDTTVLIDVLRDVRATIDRLRAARDLPLISAISVDEVRAGMQSSEREATENLLSWPIVVPVDAEVATASGDWRREYASRGITLGRADALIAASALVYGATLATSNVKDFPMPELTVEDWSPP